MSSSNSATSQATNQTDNRRVIGERGISAENSSISVVNNTLDADVINRAMTAVKDSGAQAFRFGGSALDFGGKALDFAGQSLDDVLGFSGRSLNLVENATGDALDFASDNAARASTLTYKVFEDALNSNETAIGRALDFGENALNRSFGTLADSQNIVADAYADAKGRGALTDKILIGAIAAMALIAFAAVKK